MEHPNTLRIEDFSYELPDSRIASHPLEKRDASKLLVCQQGHVQHDQYRNIADYIPSGSLMVFNNTKVVHARLLFRKPTGGIIEIFCLEPHQQYADIQTAMLQKEKVWWKCLVGGAAKWRHGTVLAIAHADPNFSLQATIVEKEAGSFTIELTWDMPVSFAEVLQHVGKVPLPPYIHREADSSDEHRYQTIYAKEAGSVAAPTAGLHFTEEVLQALKEKSVATGFVALHVGAGTFKPVKSETMQAHDMHAEWIDVDVDIIGEIIAHLGKGIIAVGTTSMRTLESLYWIGAQLLQHIAPGQDSIGVRQWLPYEFATNATPLHALQAINDWLLQTHQTRLITKTQIIIAPGYTFKIVKGLVTNFHQPRSTLLLLVAAFVGPDWKSLYSEALENNYRFLSYGDGCLLLP